MCKFLKNKKAQAAIEFCLAIPVVLLLTLGVLDIAKANIIKLETTQAMQAYLSIASADADKSNIRDGNVIKGLAGSYIQDTSLFCTIVDGAKTSKSCKEEPVRTTLKLEAAGRLDKAGTEICMTAISSYTPFYKGIYSGDTMQVYSRACTLMETAKSTTAGWDRM